MDGDPPREAVVPEDARDGLRHRKDVRRLLGLLFVLNFGSIGVYLLPWGEVDAGLLPDPVERAAGAVLPPVKSAVFPAVRHWLDATATRQHWTLFAPSPSHWTASLRAVAWYPEPRPDAVEGNGDGAGEGVVAFTPDGRPVGWRGDTLAVVHAEAVPYPHWLNHRRYRIAFNMGYDRWGGFYRPIYARWLCGTERDPRGISPDGVELEVVWRRMPVPWEPTPADSVYVQPLGGFTCHALLDREAPDYFEEAARPPAGVRGGPSG